MRLDQTVPGTATTIQVRDPLRFGNPVLRTLSLPATEPGVTTYDLDLQDFPAGVYRFTGGNVAPVTLAVGVARQPDLLGLISLQLADWIGAAFDLHFQSLNP